VKMIPKGLHVNRLNPAADNPREVEFTAQWETKNKHVDLLDALFSVPCYLKDPDRCGHDTSNGPIKRPLGDVTKRDRVVAATIFQWLGSDCGIDAVRQSLARCGYRIEKTDDV